MTKRYAYLLVESLREPISRFDKVIKPLTTKNDGEDYHDFIIADGQDNDMKAAIP